MIKWGDKMREEKERNQGIPIEPSLLPKGGASYQGIGESYETELSTGNFSITIPIYTSPCRGYEPKFALTYRSAAGNGIFGVGFELNIPYIIRKTSNGVPTYEREKDVFVSSEFGELTCGKEKERQGKYRVFQYVPICEKPQYEFELFCSEQDSYWKVTSGENEVFLYGFDGNSRVIGERGQVFQWLLKESCDCHNNKTKYFYEEEKGNRYPSKVFYGNYGMEQEEQFCFEVRFAYEFERKDMFVSYRSGFPIETAWRCRSISMIHHWEQGQEVVVRTTEFVYEDLTLSVLTKVIPHGYCRQLDGTRKEQTLPAFELSYTMCDPKTQQFQLLLLEEGEMKGDLSSCHYQFVDLYSEGIAGVLYSDFSSCLYYEPLGDGKYKAPYSLNEIPTNRNWQERQKYRFLSLDGDGAYDLVVNEKNQNGFYENQGGKFEPFVPFERYPNIANIIGKREWGDLAGNRQKSMFFIENERLFSYASLGKKGMGEQSSTKLPKDFPKRQEKTEVCFVTFTEITGDGLSHRVKVQNGKVEYWPNLSEGYFGEKREMKNAPYFGETFDARRVYFADTDGSGTKDFLYFYEEYVEVYKNQGGIYFQEPYKIFLPQTYSMQDEIQFCDVLGQGYESMIFTKRGNPTRNYQFDFYGKKKPYLIKTVDNHRGQKVEIEYQSSVEQYLEDKKKGIVWKSRVPFPVFVVSRVEKIDFLSGVHTKYQYQYRHGYYEKKKKEFCGFLSVEEEKSEWIEDTDYQGAKGYTHYWYHVGQELSGYEAEFWNGDQEAYHMPKLEVERIKGRDGAEALYALKGKEFRREVYEVEGDQLGIPLEIKECAYHVIEKEVIDKKYGCYAVRKKEEMLWRYEKNADDPRVEHRFYLSYDPYENLTEAFVVYPKRRRANAFLKEQSRAFLYETFYANRTDSCRLIGVECAKKCYELVSPIFDEERLYFDKAKKEVERCRNGEIPFGREWQEGGHQARLEEWECYFYWDEEQKEALPFQRVGTRKLLHHKKTAVFPEKMDIGIDEEEIFKKDCGYQKEDGYWWSYGLYQYYNEECHDLLEEESNGIASKDPFLYQRTRYQYDAFSLLPVEIRRWEEEESEQVTSYHFDRDTLQYDRMVDPNYTVQEVLFDGFGNVTAYFFYGEVEGKREGSSAFTEYKQGNWDVSFVLGEKEAWIQKARTVYFYDFFAYEREGLPTSILCLQNEFGAEEEEQQIESFIQYYDGRGNRIQEKVEDESIYFVKEYAIYNEDREKILEYQPCESDNAFFEKRLDANFYRWREYDCFGRLTKEARPFLPLEDGTYITVFSKVEYDSWETRFYDENDTLLQKDSDYRLFLEEKDQKDFEEKRDGLLKGLTLAGEPRVEYLDCMGNKSAEFMAEKGGELLFYEYDQKQRLIKCSSCCKDNLVHTKMEMGYTMTGSLFHIRTNDAKEEYRIDDMFGRLIHRFDGNQNHCRYRYNAQNQKTELFVEGFGVLEKTIYGTAKNKDWSRQCVGREIQQWDQAGVIQTHCYHIHGMPYKRTRTYCKDYENLPEWSKEEEGFLEEEQYVEILSYTMSKRLHKKKMPNGDSIYYQYNGRGLLCYSYLLSKKEERSGEVWLSYAPNGFQRKKQLGNGCFVETLYDPVTCSLQEKKVMSSSGNWIQARTYFYDPKNNITKIKDGLSKTIHYHSQVTNGVWDYTYDGEDQLIQATGRELPSSSGGNDYEKLETYTENYSYDSSGNLIKVSHHAPSTNWTREFAMEEGSNRILSCNEKELQYDGCGNVIKMPNTMELVWNSLNQLRLVFLVKREQECHDMQYYMYNSEGICVRKVTTRKTKLGVEEVDKRYVNEYEILKIKKKTLFAQREQIAVNSTDQSPLFTVHHYWKGNEGEETATNDVFYCIENHLHSIEMEIATDGTIVRFEEYSPFGQTVVSFEKKNGKNKTAYRYCNKEKDGHTGFYNYGHRYYCPFLGRMLSLDWIEFFNCEDKKTLNRYAYAQNNPITFSDFQGFCVVRLYHGTTWAGGYNIRQKGIDLTYTRADTDFGVGFYTTRNLDQAREWADLLQYNNDSSKRRSIRRGCVLTYEIPQDRFDELRGYQFQDRVIEGRTEPKPDWKFFVYHNRTMTADTIHRYDNYDYLEGKMLFGVDAFVENYPVYKGDTRVRAGGNQVVFKSPGSIVLLNQSLK